MTNRAVSSAQGSAETARADFPLLDIRRVSKHFGGARALDGVAMQVAAGEVHALLGHNGSGKSTLIKILAGFHAPDQGASIHLRGSPLDLPLRPGSFRGLGISFVHQHLGLIPGVSVLENLLLVKLSTRARWKISWQDERRRAKALFERFDLPLDPDSPVSHLSSLERALLAIVRAIDALSDPAAPRPGLLVLDEPTPFLPNDEVERLFKLIHKARLEGTSTIFVSHDVNEVLRISDRATILRDGRVVGSRVCKDTEAHDLISLIVGASVSDSPGTRPEARATRTHRRVVAHIEDLQTAGLRKLSLSLKEGDILGLTGLMGSGFDLIPYALFGARPSRGRLVLEKTDMMPECAQTLSLENMTPVRAMHAGLALVPADRLHNGLVGGFSLSENLALPVLGSRYPSWFVDARRTRIDARNLLEQYDVRAPLGDPAVEALSGGNQQKVLLAKWFQRSPRMILLDEPTQGVDVGARRQVFEQIDRAANDGTVIICASSDHDQLAKICTRVAIFYRGALVRILEGDDVDKDTIADACLAGDTVASN